MKKFIQKNVELKEYKKLLEFVVEQQINLPGVDLLASDCTSLTRFGLGMRVISQRKEIVRLQERQKFFEEKMALPLATQSSG